MAETTEGPFTELVCAELERINDELIGELQSLGRPDAGLVATALNEAFLVGDAPRWQPVETAPKTGDLILAFRPRKHNRKTLLNEPVVHEASYLGQTWGRDDYPDGTPCFDCGEVIYGPQVVGWMPKPGPPEVTS